MRTMLPPDESAPIINWLHHGVTRAGFTTEVNPIIEKRCLICHDGSNPHIPNLTGFDNVKKLTEADTGTPIDTLIRVSHIPLFGITMVFFIMGWMFSHAYGRPVWLKCAVIAIPFLADISDISSWYFIKLFHPFGWVVMGGGALDDGGELCLHVAGDDVPDVVLPAAADGAGTVRRHPESRLRPRVSWPSTAMTQEAHTTVSVRQHWAS